MQKLAVISVIWALSNPIFFPISYAQPITMTYKMPLALLKQLTIETQQRQRGECQQKKQEIFSNHFYTFNSDKLLLLLGLPDYFCNTSSFMPVTIDGQGHWEFGAVIESNPSELLTDNTPGLWLVSHFEIEGVFPLLHHSTDGVHWQEINLPKPRHIDCCFEYLKQICVTERQIQLKFTGIDDTPVEYWATSINASLTVTPHWQKPAQQQIKNNLQCQTKPLTSGDWQRKPAANGEEILFQSAASHLTVIVPRWLKQ